MSLDPREVDASPAARPVIVAGPRPGTVATGPSVVVASNRPGLVGRLSGALPEAKRFGVVTDADALHEVIDGGIDVVLVDDRLEGVSVPAVMNRVRDREAACRVAHFVESFGDGRRTPRADVVLPTTAAPGEVHEVVEALGRRADYDAHCWALFDLVEYQAELEEGRSAGDLRDDPEYAAVRDGIRSHRRRMDEIAAAMVESGAVPELFSDLV